jgi:hypothetical protein
LLVGILGFSAPIHAQSLKETSYPWETYKVANPKLAYVQAQALLRKDSGSLNEWSSQSGVDKLFIQITTGLTDAAIQELRRYPEATFDERAANAFAAWMQFSAENLIKKEDTNAERIKKAKIDVFGLIYWMITDENLNPLPSVKITLDLLKKVHGIFCPLYPFC